MKVDIYKIKGRDTYLFVKNGVDVTELDIDADFEVTAFKQDVDISAQDNLIGANATDIMSEISENGYSLKQVRIITTEKD
jgi:hypothetical protein